MVELRPSRKPRYRSYHIYGVDERQAIALKECLESKPDIYSVTVDVGQQLLIANLAPRTYTWEVEDAAAAAGFIVKRLRSPFDESDGRLEVVLLVLSALATVASFLGAYHNVFSGVPAEVLGLFIVVVCGYPILRRALVKMLRQKFDADLSMSIAIVAPFFYSLISGMPLYYASGLFVFIALSSSVLNRYIRPRFEAADFFIPSIGKGKDGWVEMKSVKAGDRLAVTPGFRVPADGTVVKGSATVTTTDTCARHMVKEGMPVDGGSTIEDREIQLKVSRDGGASRLNGMAAAVRNSRKPVEVQRNFPKSIERILLPVSLLSAGFGFLIMGRAGAAAGILLVAAPCATILARPLSLVLAGLGARRTGILFESHGSMERISMTDTVIFDGLEAVADGSKLASIDAAQGHTEEEVKAIISLYGTNPAFAHSKSDDFSLLSLSDAARIGPVPDDLLKRARACESKGMLTRFALQGQDIIGMAAFEIMVPEELARSIERLNRINGMSVMLLSAETPGAPEGAGKKLGIRVVKSRMRDDERFQYIEKLTAGSKNVLAAGRGCGMARFVANAGTVTIERPMHGLSGLEDATCGSPADVYRLFTLSKKAVRRTNEGMWIGLYFNMFALVAASSGLISIEIAVLMVTASIVAVALNSARMYLADAR